MRKDAGIILFNKENKVLLQLRDNNPNIEFQNCWVLFGGGVKPGELPEEALKREILEEINLSFDKFEFFRSYYYKNRIRQYIFISECNNDPAKIKLNEGADLRFFSKRELDMIPMGFNIREVLEDFFIELENGKIGKNS